MSIPEGYTAHHSVDMGGRIANITGSPAFYNTLVNMHSGPRVMGETFEMHALPDKGNLPFDSLKVSGSGFGGDPYSYARLDTFKGKFFEFSGLFRRDRQYFDYDLLANPNIVPNTIAVGPNKAPTGSIAWGGISQSPMMFNTVRRLTDTHLTLNPVSTFTYRFGYSQSIFEGPSMSPAYTIGKYDALLLLRQRNSTDGFNGAIDWKPVQGTRVTFEEQVDHYKGDSYFTLDPNGFQAQFADGMRAYLGNWDSQTPYGIGACATGSMGSGNYTNSSTYTIFSNPQRSGGLPVLNPACSAITSYRREEPMRFVVPTEAVRFQSSSIKNVSMNGDFRYTLANMSSTYYENVLGLVTLSGSAGAIRQITYNGFAQGHRSVISADYGLVWQATKEFALEEQVNISTVHQPGYSDTPAAATLQTASGNGNQTVAYSGPLVAGHAQALPHGINGVYTLGYFGQSFVINNLTGSWDVNPRTRLSLTYRYSNHKIGQGVPHTGPVDQSVDPYAGMVEITENAGILGAAFRPTTNWSINGSAEIGYADNAFTTMTPRQLRQYRVHTIFHPKPWATVTGAFNDRERHNNTNNNQGDVAAGDVTYYGPLDHVDHLRIGAVSAVLSPNEHYGLDLSYSYTDVYSATNICFASGAAAGLPGAATLNSSGGPNVCPGLFARGSTTILTDFYARDFMSAPTQFASAAINVSPVQKVQSSIGYG